MSTRQEKLRMLETEVQRRGYPLKWADGGWPAKLLWRLGFDVPPTMFWPVWAFVLIGLSLVPFVVAPIELVKPQLSDGRISAFEPVPLMSEILTAVLVGAVCGVIARVTVKRAGLSW